MGAPGTPHSHCRLLGRGCERWGSSRRPLGLSSEQVPEQAPSQPQRVLVLGSAQRFQRKLPASPEGCWFASSLPSPCLCISAPFPVVWNPSPQKAKGVWFSGLEAKEQKLIAASRPRRSSGHATHSHPAFCHFYQDIHTALKSCKTKLLINLCVLVFLLNHDTQRTRPSSG